MLRKSVLFSIVLLTSCLTVPPPKNASPDQAQDPEAASQTGRGQDGDVGAALAQASDMPSALDQRVAYHTLPEGDFEILYKTSDQIPHVVVSMLDGKAQGQKYWCVAKIQPGCKPLRPDCAAVDRGFCFLSF